MNSDLFRTARIFIHLFNYLFIYLFCMKVLPDTFIFWACYSKNFMCVFYLYPKTVCSIIEYSDLG